MQFIDLKAQQRLIFEDLNQRIAGVMRHGVYIMGPEVTELEERLKAFTGCEYCISCSSGTDALLMVLMAWDIGPGDAVFLPPFTFFATAEVVAMLGAVPVFVDIDPRTFNMRTDELAKAMEAVIKQDQSLYPIPEPAKKNKLRPAAIIPVDLFGQAADYEKILAIANEYGLKVMEDAAQSFGGSRNNRKNCALGCQAAITSFFPAKPLGCYGDGGAIFTDDEDLASKLRSIRVHGQGADKYDNIRIGVNGRMDTMQAAVLLAKLAIFDDEIDKRQQVAARYSSALAGMPGITPPQVEPNCVSAWAQYSILAGQGKRDNLAVKLKARDIPTNIYYPKPLHMLQVFKSLGYEPFDMPNALAAAESILALPFHPYLSGDDIAKVTSAVKDIMNDEQ